MQAMNFRDVLLATTTIPLEAHFSYKSSYMGFEFSGFDEKRKRVMGITHGKGLASSAITDPRFVWPVPDSWTLKQAATVPVVYATVLYAFHYRGRIKPGKTVLIHAVTGGVGQAAISTALNHGCNVLTTVGTPDKRELIKKLFPQIKDEQIGNSRDTSFEAQFMELTVCTTLTRTSHWVCGHSCKILNSTALSYTMPWRTRWRVRTVWVT